MAAAKQFLSARFGALALKLQEAAESDGLTNSDVCRRLSDQLQDLSKTTGMWCYYMDHIGDGESGDVIYSCGGDVYKAPYTISQVNGKASCAIDTESAIDVVPRTVYEEEAEDDDHYAAMESAKLYRSRTDFPAYERFISKGERKSAPSGSFAGKGKSFPILKPGDVMAAVRSMGRAGSENYDTATLKRNIIRIAKAKGWTKELPKAWQGDDSSSKESAVQSNPANRIRLTESSSFSCDITLREAFSDGKRIKLISPGRGSTAFYTPEALQQAAADKIFRAGTPMRIDHPTQTQEAERPEGSVKDWGAVLAKDAYWMESGPAGAGLYSEIKPFSDHAQTIDEKGPYAGVSIAAYGEALKDSVGKPVMREGVPVLARFSSADGVDMVTRAGAGGMFLTEAAKPANTRQEDSDMDAAELTALRESQKKLLERAIRGDARDFAQRTLKGISLHEAGKDLVIESVMRDIPTKDGELDEAKFKEAIDAEAKRVGAAIAAAAGSGQVRGMGTPAPVVDAKESERQASEEKKLRESRIANYMRLGLTKEAAEKTVDRYSQEAA